MSHTSRINLRLPRWIRAGIEKLSKQDGISINQFVSIAAAEKLAIMQAETYFAERIAKADMAAFDRVMQRQGGQPPREGDEI